jgi:hypothetical protein
VDFECRDHLASASTKHKNELKSYQDQYMEMPAAQFFAMRSHVGSLQAEVKLKASARGCAAFV